MMAIDAADKKWFKAGLVQDQLPNPFVLSWPKASY
ncbi:MAG: hypothetical protein JWQ21_2734 [Herminiimonas sp.]|nr:hypothetical protein [Herminiimonas sp.]